jgi:hypothetical protein
VSLGGSWGVDSSRCDGLQRHVGLTKRIRSPAEWRSREKTTGYSPQVSASIPSACVIANSYAEPAASTAIKATSAGARYAS